MKKMICLLGFLFVHGAAQASSLDQEMHRVALVLTASMGGGGEAYAVRMNPDWDLTEYYTLSPDIVPQVLAAGYRQAGYGNYDWREVFATVQRFGTNCPDLIKYDRTGRGMSIRCLAKAMMIVESHAK